MNDLDTRLPRMLSDAADRFTIHPDLDDVVDLERPRLARIEQTAHSSGLLLVVGVAAAIVLLIGGLVVVSARSYNQPLAPSDAPAAVADPVLFPVVDDVPAWAGDLYGSYRIPDDPPSSRQVWSVLARPDGEDGFTDQIVVVAQEQRSAEDRTGFEEVTIDGRSLFVRRFPGKPGQTEMANSPDGAEPFLSVTGDVDEALLAQVLAGASVSGRTADFGVAIDAVPDGYEVVVEPVALREQVLSAAATSKASTLDVAVDSVWTDPRLRVAAFAGDVTAVKIGDTIGWYSQPIGAPEGSYTIAWSPSRGITIVADISNLRLSADEAISIARHVRLTSEDDWRETLRVEDNPLPERAPLVIGQPVPVTDECQTTVATIDSSVCD